jgi:4-hydroxybenzoate polyprenyltransferase
VAFAVFLPWLFQVLSMIGDKEMLLENQEWMHVTLHIVLIYIVFAFMMTLIREIVKDMEDVKGDGRSHCRTIPVVWGMNAAQIIVIALSFLTCLGVSITSDYLYKEFGFSITCYMLKASYLLLLGFGIASNTYTLVTDKSKRTEKTFRIQSIAMKIIMLIGVLSIIFIK